MGIQLSTECSLPFGQGVFPFLELPAEIRNQIYCYLLSTQYLKANKVSISTTKQRSVHETAILESSLQERSKPRYKFQTAITKVNRQIRDETYHVLRKENLFVRVTSHSKVLDSYEELLKPIVLAQNKQARAFKHHAMAIHIQACANLVSDRKKFPTLGFETTFIIAGDDLQTFCKLLLRMDQEQFESPILECGSIQISLNNLSEGRMDNKGAEPASHTASVRRLLEPLRCLRGVGEVHITGDASCSYKQNIEEVITRSPVDFRVSRKALREAWNKGMTAYVSGDFRSAIAEYQKGNYAMDQVIWGTLADPRRKHWGIGPNRIMHGRLQIWLKAAELRLEVERVAREAAEFAEQHPPPTGSDIHFVDLAVYQALMWHFANFLAGKDVAEVDEFKQCLKVVLELEPRNSRVKTALAEMERRWSSFLGFPPGAGVDRPLVMM